MILGLFLSSCNTANVNQTPFVLENFILGTPAPEESKVGELSGCFAAKTVIPPKSLNYFVFYNIFRFYNDGTVIGVQVSINTDSIQESWEKIRVWLNREDDALAQGTYHIINNQIWFDMSATGYMMAEYYYGNIDDNSIILSSYAQRNGSDEEKDVEYLELDCASQ